jgi:hypothetical protein
LLYLLVISCVSVIISATAFAVGLLDLLIVVLWLVFISNFVFVFCRCPFALPIPFCVTFLSSYLPNSKDNLSSLKAQFEESRQAFLLDKERRETVLQKWSRNTPLLDRIASPLKEGNAPAEDHSDRTYREKALPLLQPQQGSGVVTSPPPPTMIEPLLSETRDPPQLETVHFDWLISKTVMQPPIEEAAILSRDEALLKPAPTVAIENRAVHKSRPSDPLAVLPPPYVAMETRHVYEPRAWDSFTIPPPVPPPPYVASESHHVYKSRPWDSLAIPPPPFNVEKQQR